MLKHIFSSLKSYFAEESNRHLKSIHQSHVKFIGNTGEICFILVLVGIFYKIFRVAWAVSRCEHLNAWLCVKDHDSYGRPCPSQFVFPQIPALQRMGGPQLFCSCLSPDILSVFSSPLMPRPCSGRPGEPYSYLCPVPSPFIGK